MCDKVSFNAAMSVTTQNVECTFFCIQIPFATTLTAALRPGRHRAARSPTSASWIAGGCMAAAEGSLGPNTALTLYTSIMETCLAQHKTIG